jgi:hypothetical protein
VLETAGVEPDEDPALVVSQQNVCHTRQPLETSAYVGRRDFDSTLMRLAPPGFAHLEDQEANRLPRASEVEFNELTVESELTSVWHYYDPPTLAQQSPHGGPGVAATVLNESNVSQASCLEPIDTH